MKRKSNIHHLVLFFLAALLPITAKAEPLRLDYDMYAGGIHAMNASILFDSTSSRYSTIFRAEIQGFLRYLLPWKGSLETKGLILYSPEFQYVPQNHTRISLWPDEIKRTEMKYDAQGNLLSSHTYFDEEGKKYDYPDDISAADPRNAPDLVTAATLWMHDAKIGKPCDARIPVFDGKRRFDLVFKPLGNETLTPSRYSSFSGDTYKCAFELDMKNERDRQKNQFYKTQEKSKRKGQPPTIWMGRMKENAPLVPVKMAVYSDYGALILHLTKQSGDKDNLK